MVRLLVIQLLICLQQTLTTGYNARIWLFRLLQGIGKGIREFNDAKSNVKNEIEEGMKERDKDEEIKVLRDQLQQKQASERPK